MISKHFPARLVPVPSETLEILFRVFHFQSPPRNFPLSHAITKKAFITPTKLMTPPITNTRTSSQSHLSDLAHSGALLEQRHSVFTVSSNSRAEIYETKPSATPLADTARSIWDSVISWWNGPEPLPEPVIQTDEVRPDFDPVASSHRIYEATQGGLSGLGTDENGVTDELKDLTPEQNNVLDKVHLSHYGVSVQEHTTSDLSGLKQEEVSARLRGEQLTGDAIALGDAFRYGTGTFWDLARTGTDEARVFATLEGKTSGELAEIERVFTHRFGKSLSEALASELSGYDLAEAQALLAGRDTTAQAVRLQRALEGWSTDTGTIEKIFANAPAEQREKVAYEYSLLTGQTLDDAFDTKLWGTEKARAQALLRGDSATGRAAALFEAQLGPGTDEVRIHAELSGLTPDELRATKEAYARHYQRNLRRDLQNELSGTDYEITLSLLKGDKVTIAQKVRHAVAGVGTDEATLLGLLSGRSTEELAQIRADYLQRYGETLDTRVLSELSGRDRFQVQQYLQGTPEDAETALAQLRKCVEFERAGASGYLLDRISGKGDLLTQNLQKAEMTLEAVKADGALSPEEYKLLKERYRYASLDLSSYQTAKDSAAETAGTVSAVAAVSASMVGTAGMTTPIVVGGAASAGGVGYIGGKALFAGKAYDRHGMLADGTIGSVEGLLIPATGGAAAGTLREAGGHILAGSVGGMTREVVEPETWKYGISAVLKRVSGAVFSEGAAGLFGGQLGRLGGNVVVTAKNSFANKVYEMRLPTEVKPAFRNSGGELSSHYEEFEILRKTFGDRRLSSIYSSDPEELENGLKLFEHAKREPRLLNFLISNQEYTANLMRFGDYSTGLSGSAKGTNDIFIESMRDSLSSRLTESLLKDTKDERPTGNYLLVGR